MHGARRTITCSIVLGLLLTTAGAFGAQIEARLRGAGTVTVALTGPVLAAEFSGNVTLDGALAGELGSYSWETAGCLAGFGMWDPRTFRGEAWVLAVTTGTSADGQVEVRVESLLHVATENDRPLRDGGVFHGAHLTLVADRARTATAFHGSFFGSLSGSLEPPLEPWTLQLSGAGMVDLSGIGSHAGAVAAEDVLPLHRESWPDDFARSLSEFLQRWDDAT